MNKHTLRYKGYGITLQEVPNEISLYFNVCGCPHKCKGCHSEYLWNEDNSQSLYYDFEKIVSKYQNYITCVCFMGGDQNIQEIIDLCKIIKQLNINEGLKIKTCLYSGDNILNQEVLKYLNYYKIGNYNEELGGLNSPETNQIFYQILNEEELNNITSFFYKK